MDNTAPDTTLSSAPANPTSQTTANFSWAGSDAISTTEKLKYSHKLDSGEWSPFSTDTSVSLTSLGDGSYTFSVKTMDQAGNVDGSPAEFTWKVDATSPTVKSWTPKGKKVKPTAKPTVAFSEAMNEASVEASANGKPTTFVLKKGAKVVPASVTYVETATGAYKATLKPNKKLRAGAKYTATVSADARDEAGNALVAKSWKFTVKR